MLPALMPPAILATPDSRSTQFAVLEALYHLGPMSLSDIAQKILTTGGNLTMVVGNLEKQGLAHRQKSPEDRRVLIVALTAKGKALMRKLFPEHAAAIRNSWEPCRLPSKSSSATSAAKLGKQGPVYNLISANDFR